MNGIPFSQSPKVGMKIAMDSQKIPRKFIEKCRIYIHIDLVIFSIRHLIVI